MYNLTKSKKLALAAITMMTILIPGRAYSLGIGELKLSSGFNQNIKGEIELRTSANEDVSNIYVGLAAPEKFDEAGIPWSNFLKKIKFKPVKKANGTTVIELSSNESLKELFLSFVLEISWNKNNLLTREFAVLIDPESIHSSATVSTGKSKHFAENSSSFNETTEGKHTHQYGPTKRTDFIWKVAKKTRYRGVSIEQMIMALYANNPDAFYSENINSLTAKKMLSLPAKGQVLEMSRKEALAAVKQQNTEWRQRDTSEKKFVPENATNIASDNAQGTSETSGSRSGKKVANFSDNEASLINSPKRKEKTFASIPSAESLALLDRLNKLEQKLDMMQALLMKDKQPTLTIPAPASSAAVVSGDRPAPEIGVEVKSKSSVSSGETLALPNNSNNPNKQNELAQKPETMQKQQTPDNPSIEPPKTQKQPATVLQPKSAHKSPFPKKNNLVANPIKLEKPATETTFISATKQEPEPERERFLMALSGLGGGLFLLGGFGSFWWMRRKLRLTNAEIERLSKYSSPAVFFKPTDLTVTDDESKFLEVPVDAFDSDHTDPVVEVDRLLSEGLYESAETLMRLTINYHPEVIEYHLKLLEIFVASKNKNAFYTHVTKLTSSGENHDLAFLQSIARMDTELRSETAFDLANLDKTADTNASTNFHAETSDNTRFDLSDFAIESDAMEFDETGNNQSGFQLPDNSQESGHKVEPVTSDLIAQSDHERVYETADNPVNQALPDNQTDSIHEIEFDSTGFISEPVAKIDIAKKDNFYSKSEWLHDEMVNDNEISFHSLDFGAEAAINAGIEFEEGEEEDAAEDVDDLFYFDTEPDTDSGVEMINDMPEESKLAHDESQSGHSHSFDSVDYFSDFDREPAARVNSNAEITTDNAVAFDLSDLYIESDANTKTDEIEDK